jgi:hypothetical protein
MSPISQRLRISSSSDAFSNLREIWAVGDETVNNLLIGEGLPVRVRFDGRWPRPVRRGEWRRCCSEEPQYDSKGRDVRIGGASTRRRVIGWLNGEPDTGVDDASTVDVNPAVGVLAK